MYQLWCWISIDWDILRIAVFYGPIWFVILLTFSIYAHVGIDITRKRRLLQSFNNEHHLENRHLNKVFEIHASKVVHITSEAASSHSNGNNNHSGNSSSSGSSASSNEQIPGKFEGKGPLSQSPNNAEPSSYPAYSVTVERGEDIPEPTSAVSEVGSSSFRFASTSQRLPRIEVNQVNSAAFAYYKYAILYFIALLVTWVSIFRVSQSSYPWTCVLTGQNQQVPSTINRVYSLFYPKNANFGLEFVSAFVLPLQGFWNSVIYIAISWSTVMEFAQR